MRINQVLLVPEFSSVGKEGNFHGTTSQKDVVQAYLETLAEQLDEDRVKYSIFGDGDIILPNSLVVCLSSGWIKPGSKARANGHDVTYGNKESEDFAITIAESICEWGKSYANFHHRGSSPCADKFNPFMKHKDTFAISVSPFKLNAVNSEEYVRWLPKLGQILSQCIYEFLLSRGEQPRMMSVNYR